MLPALVAIAGVATAGCGETVIDSAKTEAALEQNLEHSTGRRVSSIDCPSGVQVTAGKTFECKVTYAGGKREVATLEIRNSDADVSVTGLRPEKGAAGE